MQVREPSGLWLLASPMIHFSGFTLCASVLSESDSGLHSCPVFSLHEGLSSGSRRVLPSLHPRPHDHSHLRPMLPLSPFYRKHAGKLQNMPGHTAPRPGGCPACGLHQRSLPGAGLPAQSSVFPLGQVAQGGIGIMGRPNFNLTR